MIETAKTNELEPYAYLRHVFTQLPRALSVDDIEALLPLECGSVKGLMLGLGGVYRALTNDKQLGGTLCRCIEVGLTLPSRKALNLIATEHTG